MNVHHFMQGCKAAWEQGEKSSFAALFAADDESRNTPLAAQRGHAALAAYWPHVKLQQDVHVNREVLVSTSTALPTDMSLAGPRR